MLPLQDLQGGDTSESDDDDAPPYLVAADGGDPPAPPMPPAPPPQAPLPPPECPPPNPCPHAEHVRVPRGPIQMRADQGLVYVTLAVNGVALPDVYKSYWNSCSDGYLAYFNFGGVARRQVPRSIGRPRDFDGDHVLAMKHCFAAVNAHAGLA